MPLIVCKTRANHTRSKELPENSSPTATVKGNRPAGEFAVDWCRIICSAIANNSELARWAGSYKSCAVFLA
jgi:hypothetical protein